MRRSDERLLTTHVGSIPRPAALRDLLVRQDRGEPVDEGALARETEAAVREVVARQLAAGIDVGNDGEQPRAGFSTYVARRMRGFGGESKRLPSRDLIDFPDYAAMLADRRRSAARITNAPEAVGDVRYEDLGEAERECDLFLRVTAAAPRPFAERFMTAVSPGTVATILLNRHYDSHERYVMALAREMRKEYELIHARGLVLARHRLPGGMLFIPGVIDTTTNYVEHPEVVADRLVQIVEAIGDKTRVLASTDCGFGTFAGSEMCAPSVVWAKLRALREGADLA